MIASCFELYSANAGGAKTVYSQMQMSVV